MSGWTKLLGVALCLVAMAFFVSWPVWKWLKFKPVSASVYKQTKALVDRTPRLRPAWDIAMQDDVLTWSEAKVILEAGGEKIGPEE
jgi:hypothetical protein